MYMEVRLSLDTKMWKILVRTRQWYTSFILFTYQSCMNLLNFGSFCYTDFLILDYLPDLRLYAVVVILYHPLHFALARHFVDKTVNDRDFLVAFSLLLTLSLSTTISA